MKSFSSESSFSDLKNYEISQKIGKGSFGEVYKVKDKSTGDFYAAKVTLTEINEANKDTEIGKSLYSEVNLMSKFNHPSIIRFVGYSPTDFNDKPNPTIITELAEHGTLKDIIELENKGQSPYGWDFTKKLINIYGIASGMQYLHKNNIIHRDLKPENIFMDDSFCPKIADFGLSKASASAGMSMNFQSEACPKGTILYFPPEILTNRTQTNTKSGDVYAFALIVYELLTAKTPYCNFEMFNLIKKVGEGYRPNITTDIPDSYKNLIEECWAEDPESRPTFDAIVEDLKNNQNYITDLVDEADFLDYISYIDESKSSFNERGQLFHFKDFVQRRKSMNFNLTTLSKSEGEIKVTICPFQLFESLSGPSQKMILEAETNPMKQFIVGQKFIEGVDQFPQNTQVGIKYLTKSISNGIPEAVIYYSRMIIEGELIPSDTKYARELLSKLPLQGDPDVLVLTGKIEHKEGNFELAKNYFIQATKQGNGESMYLYASMLVKGEGVEVNHDEALRYFTMAIKNGYNKEIPRLLLNEPPIESENKKGKDDKEEKKKGKDEKKKGKEEKKKDKDEEKKDKDEKSKKKDGKQKSTKIKSTVHEFKIVFYGSSNEQKVELLYVLNGYPFPERYVPTYFESRTLDFVVEGIPIKLHIWDSPNFDDSDFLRPITYSGANLVGFTFLLNDRETFEMVKKKWYKEAIRCSPSATMVLIGLCLEERKKGDNNCVTDEEAKQLVHKLKLDGYIPCSAKTGENVDKVYPMLIKQYFSKHDSSCVIA